MGDADATTRVPARPDPQPLPVTRPRGRGAFLLPVVVAAAGGLAAGVTPGATLVVAAALVSAVVLAVRLEWAALVVVGTAVFEDYLDVLSPWTLEWLALLLVVAWAIRRARGPLHEHRTMTVLAPAAVFTAVLLLALAVHVNGHDGLAVAARYAGFVIVLLVLADAFSGTVRPRRAARVYVLSCVLAALCGLATALADERHWVSGPVHDPDDLAFFLIAAVPLVGTARAHRGRSMWPVWAAAAVLLAGILGSHSRGAYAAVVALVVVAMATRVLAIRYAGILLALLATCAALALAVLPHDLHGALDQQQRFAEDKVAHRLDLWHAAATMTREHPALGLGPGAFARYHLDYGDEEREAAERDLDDAHSTVLQASSELGVIGAVALLGLFLVPAAAAWRRWQRDRSQLAAATCLAVAGALVASSLETEQFRLPLWFLAALAAALGHERRHRMALLGDSSSGQVVARK